jgi:hypothetical protein
MALEGGYEAFGDLREALEYVARFLEIPLGRYVTKSNLIRHIEVQSKLR